MPQPKPSHVNESGLITLVAAVLTIQYIEDSSSFTIWTPVLDERHGNAPPRKAPDPYTPLILPSTSAATGRAYCSFPRLFITSMIGIAQAESR
jgi:hypothetical protein